MNNQINIKVPVILEEVSKISEITACKKVGIENRTIASLQIYLKSKINKKDEHPAIFSVVI